jgi:hypothetical protein
MLLTMAKRLKTLSEAETARRRAITGLRNLGRDNEADRIEDMSTREYAEEKNFGIAENPRSRRRMNMAKRTNSDLQDAYDDIATVKGLLQDAYTPESSREELAEAVGSALNALEDYEGPEEEADEDEDGDED